MLIDRDDANKVLQSMMKIMEEIFTGTMKRFMGSGEPVSNVDTTSRDTTGNENRDQATRPRDQNLEQFTSRIPQSFL